MMDMEGARFKGFVGKGRSAMSANDNRKELPPEAKRALEEAKERRKAEKLNQKAAPKEILGRDGPDPTRFRDWEKDGIISDF